MEDDADALPQALEQFTETARAHISSRSVDTLLLAALAEIAARAEAAILHNKYDREGGLAVERRARRLASWAGSSAGAARERCARLTQVAALLALEQAAHARDALPAARRLTAPEARDVLARRSDFKMEEIKRLKL
ncbi:conserved oligomeric Golgi complex subunit 4-like [Trichoplusia ni]|uniref:Conserved oligomeric Golgi complex subunit 4-like n=1 Tax=Trichoplusia ni TaxID=7111 RepID=A0A7E5WCI8_TRINI|nr:conserved oligomeric Golgi complex subunit 4-like [Trichoplusia ni]